MKIGDKVCIAPDGADDERVGDFRWFVESFQMESLDGTMTVERIDEDGDLWLAGANTDGEGPIPANPSWVVPHRETVPEAKPSILDEAKAVVDGPRRETYGHPRENHSCTARMWSAYLTRRLGVEVTLDPRDVCWLNILQKGSRDSHVRHRDNLVDTAGWARNAEIVDEPKEPK